MFFFFKIYAQKIIFDDLWIINDDFCVCAFFYIAGCWLIKLDEKSSYKRLTFGNVELQSSSVTNVLYLLLCFGCWICFSIVKENHDLVKDHPLLTLTSIPYSSPFSSKYRWTSSPFFLILSQKVMMFFFPRVHIHTHGYFTISIYFFTIVVTFLLFSTHAMIFYMYIF